MGPYNDYFMKFYEAAKYYYYPGWHEPGGGIELCMNSSWWGSLSDWERAVITTCCMEEHAAQYEECQANNGAYLVKLVEEHGVELKQFGEDIYEGFGEASAEMSRVSVITAHWPRKSMIIFRQHFVKLGAGRLKPKQHTLRYETEFLESVN